MRRRGVFAADVAKLQELLCFSSLSSAMYDRDRAQQFCLAHLATVVSGTRLRSFQNKSACANNDEREIPIHHGNDRSEVRLN
jgi:hypothetical protein